MEALFVRRHSMNQQGSALIVALLLMVVITLLALAGARNTILQERMAGNMHDRNMAFQAAEAGLRAGEREIQRNTVPSAIDPQSGPADFWVDYFDENQDAASMGQAGFAEEGYSLSGDPQFVIEELAPQPSLIADDSDARPIYRITTRARGGRPETIVILQSAYTR